MRPASLTKLFVASAALDILGPEYRARTVILAAGAIRDGVLEGDLWIKAGADPTILPETVSVWGAELRELGINRVSGNLIIDDSAYTGPWRNLTLERGDVAEPWAAPATPFAVARNRAVLGLLPGAEVGELGQWEGGFAPGPDDFRILAQTSTPGTPAVLRVTPGDDEEAWQVLGELPARVRSTITIAPRDPAVWSAQAAKADLAHGGVEIVGESILRSRLDTPEEVVAPPSDKDVLLTHRSPPLRDWLVPLNKESDNFMAEMLLLHLGGKASTESPASLEQGLAALRAYTAKRLSNITGERQFVLRDGSGLSWRNLVTPRQIVTMLRLQSVGPHGILFRSTLPVAGLDGTMRHRMGRSAALGNVYAKSGYLPGTRTMAGMLTTPKGERLVFALVTNNYIVPTATINAAHEAIVEALLEL